MMAVVEPDHTLTVRVPDEAPEGLAEVIVLISHAKQDPEALMGNGPAILKALEELPQPDPKIWDEIREEIRISREEWDRED